MKIEEMLSDMWWLTSLVIIGTVLLTKTPEALLAFAFPTIANLVWFFIKD